MKDILGNKKLLLVVSAVLAIIILVSAYFLLFNKSGSKPTADTTGAVDMGPVDISPDDIGLELTASPDKKKVKITINKLAGINAVTYELTYEADSTSEEQSEGGDSRIQRGITGDAKIKSGDSRYESPWLDLGSCSKNVCRYDQGVTSVDLILKITKDNNKIYSTEKKLEL